MRNLNCFLVLLFAVALTSCKSGYKASTTEKPLEETLDEKNKQNISLLNRIRKLPGVTVRAGIPIFNKGNNSMQSNNEPLYILDDYAVGNSFKSLNGLVESVNVKKIEVLSTADAAFYGARASSGVIKITTYQ